MKKERVVVAMSGGVDSSVAACLLQRQGYEVIGVTMCFPAYSGLKAVEDARQVAHKLGIRHCVFNMQEVLERKVIKDFCLEYLSGRTPNPCVRCNEYIKFGALLKKALSLDARYLATGHYARIEKNKNYLLKKAKDKIKDQSYFLYRLGQSQLRHVLFPLGDYTKSEVRALARRFGLAVAEKAESQEICFLPGNNYREFLAKRSADTQDKRSVPNLTPGPIVDKQGKVLGEHRSIAFYTVGQREGLGVARGFPVYITGIDAKNNKIVVGSRRDALCNEFLVRQPHFILNPVKKKIAVKVKIRYNHPEAAAQAIPVHKHIKIRFKQPQFAVTPGQSAVFYIKDTVLGGGIIEACNG